MIGRWLAVLVVVGCAPAEPPPAAVEIDAAPSSSASVLSASLPSVSAAPSSARAEVSAAAASAEVAASSEPSAVPALEIVAKSNDGRRALALRKRSDAPLLRDLVLTDGTGAGEVVLVVADPASPLPGGAPRNYFHAVAFDPRGEGRAFFSTSDGASQHVFAIDLATRAITRITKSFGFEHLLIAAGPHKGDLVVVEHRYPKDGGPAFDVCLLVDGRTGRTIRDVTSLDTSCTGTPELRKALGF